MTLRKLSLWAMGFIALALCAFVAVGCAQEQPAAETVTVDNSDQIEKLVVGFDAEYPPYGYIGTDGKYTGIDLDLAQEVADRNGWEFEATPIDWDSKDAMLNQGDINCIWNGFTIEGREDDYTFSEPYMLNAQVIVVKADSDINGYMDLEGKTVITQADSAALEVLQGDMADVAATFAGGAPQQIGDYNSAFMQLESGAVDAVACDLSIAAYQMAANPDKYKQLDRELAAEHYGVGFKLGSQAIADTVSKTLYEMYKDGTVEKILEKYADDGVSIENWVLVADPTDGSATNADASEDAEMVDQQAVDEAEGANAE